MHAVLVVDRVAIAFDFIIGLLRLKPIPIPCAFNRSAGHDHAEGIVVVHADYVRRVPERGAVACRRSGRLGVGAAGMDVPHRKARMC